MKINCRVDQFFSCQFRPFLQFPCNVSCMPFIYRRVCNVGKRIYWESGKYLLKMNFVALSPSIVSVFVCYYCSFLCAQTPWCLGKCEQREREDLFRTTRLVFREKEMMKSAAAATWQSFTLTSMTTKKDFDWGQERVKFRAISFSPKVKTVSYSIYDYERMMKENFFLLLLLRSFIRLTCQ